MSFPANPVVGQLYTGPGGRQYTYNSSGAWDLVVTSAASSTVNMIAGSGAPTIGIGAAGNYYLDTVAGIVYGPKTATGWPASGTSLGGGGGGGGKFTSSATAPASPSLGDAWFDTSVGTLYQRVGDSGGNAGWLDVSTGGASAVDGNTIAGSGAPVASVGSTGDYYIDSATGNIYGPKTTNGWPSSGSNTALTTANTALTTANTANTTANSALAKANSAVTASSLTGGIGTHFLFNSGGLGCGLTSYAGGGQIMSGAALGYKPGTYYVTSSVMTTCFYIFITVRIA